MKLFINGRFLTQDMTGVQRVATEIVLALDSALERGEYEGLDVELVVPALRELTIEPDLRVIKIRRLGRFGGHAWEQLELPRYVGSQPLLCLGNLAPVASLYGRGPVFTMVHDLSYHYVPEAYGFRFRALYGTVMPQVLRKSRIVFTVSESEASAITGSYGHILDRERLVVAPNGGVPPVSDGGEVRGYSERERRCLYVGSLTKRKNADGIANLATWASESADADFALAGSTARAFSEVNGSSEPSSRVVLLGQLNEQRQLDDEYRRAKVFVFPSFYESSGLPTTEAMRLGCPVVASDIPALRERCGDAALYADPTDITTFQTQIQRLLDNEALWKDFQRRGLQRASLFTWDTQAKIVVEAILKTFDPDGEV